MLFAVRRPDGSYIEVTGRYAGVAFERAVLCDKDLYRIAFGASEKNAPTQHKAAEDAGYKIEEIKIVSVTE